jgi:hypothetical protein
MNPTLLILGILISSFLFGQEKSESNNFQLTYIYAGLGSGYNSMQPVFKVNGNDCIYTLEENSSWTGEFTQEPDTLFIGKFRQSSIDSIIDLISDIKDTLIYNTNPEIMSGGIHSIKIATDGIDLTFRLHNASDPVAEKIVAILNSNIPGEIRKTLPTTTHIAYGG